MKLWKVKTSFSGCCPDDHDKEDWFLVHAENEFGAIRYLLRSGNIERWHDDVDSVTEICGLTAKCKHHWCIGVD